MTMVDTDSKQLVMKSLNKLKHEDEDSIYRKLSVTYDMSKSEREINKEKLKEAKELNDLEIREKSGTL